MGGPLDRAVHASFGNTGSFGQQFAGKLVTGLANRAITVALEGKGKIDIANIAADAFGNALGNSIVGEIHNSVAEKQQLQQRSRSNGSAAPSITPLTEADLQLAPGSLPSVDELIPEFDVAPSKYTVQSGDTLSGILGTSDPAAIGAFMRANGLTDSMIRPGDQLSLPSGNYSSADAALGQATLNIDNARLAAQQQQTPISTGFYGSLDMPTYSGGYTASAQGATNRSGYIAHATDPSANHFDLAGILDIGSDLTEWGENLGKAGTALAASALGFRAKSYSTLMAIQPASLESMVRNERTSF